MRRAAFVIGLLIPVAAASFSMWKLDPYHIFTFENELDNPKRRAAVAYEIRRAKANAAFVGTSRAVAFNNELFEGLGYSPAVNIGLTGSSLEEHSAYFTYAEMVHPLKVALIEMSEHTFQNWKLADFSADRLIPPSAMGDPKAGARYMRTLISDWYFAVLSKESLLTLADPLRKDKATAAVIKKINELRSKTAVAAKPAQTKIKPVEHLRSIIDTAERSQTKLYFFIPPLLASHQESTYGKRWEKFQLWKRDLVEELAVQEDQRGVSYELWDFSGYNSITLQENKPRQSYAQNEYYGDFSHFRPNVAKMIFDRVFGTCGTECDMPPDFGILVTRENIDEHLANKTTERDAYLRSLDK